MKQIKKYFRAKILKLAIIIHKLSKGKITPNFLSYFNVLAFLLIGYLIIINQNFLAAILLVIFGLVDTLDGELARYQKVASIKGMLLDATTDRIRETIIFASLAYQLINLHHQAIAALLVVWALGTSLMISFVKAKGEAALASQKSIDHQKLNRIFGGGLMSFEFRSFLIIIGLLFDEIILIMWLIVILGTLTYIVRFIKINRALKNV